MGVTVQKCNIANSSKNCKNKEILLFTYVQYEVRHIFNKCYIFDDIITIIQ